MSEKEIEHLARSYEALQSLATALGADASELGYHEAVTVLGRIGQVYGSLAGVLRAKVETTEITSDENGRRVS